MIQDKDFTLRLIRQLTQALEKLLLGKPEESLMQKELDFDLLMRDIFDTDFATISSKSISEIMEIVEAKEDRDRADYYEMLGNLFMFHYQQEQRRDFAEKAKRFYEIYLEKSKIFALSIINRINMLERMLKIN